MSALYGTWGEYSASLFNIPRVVKYTSLFLFNKLSICSSYLCIEYSLVLKGDVSVENHIYISDGFVFPSNIKVHIFFFSSKIVSS